MQQLQAGNINFNAADNRLRVKQLESEKMAANQDSRLLQSEQENVKARQECEDMRKRLEMLKQAVREERQRAQETTPQASAVVSDELMSLSPPFLLPTT